MTKRFFSAALKNLTNFKFAGGGRLEVRSDGPRQNLPVRLHDSMRGRHGAHHIPSADLLRQHQAHRHPLL